MIDGDLLHSIVNQTQSCDQEIPGTIIRFEAAPPARWQLDNHTPLVVIVSRLHNDESRAPAKEAVPVIDIAQVILSAQVNVVELA